MKKTRGGKRKGAGAPLLGSKKRVEIKTSIDIETKSKLDDHKKNTGKSIGQTIDCLVSNFLK